MWSYQVPGTALGSSIIISLTLLNSSRQTSVLFPSSEKESCPRPDTWKTVEWNLVSCHSQPCPQTWKTITPASNLELCSFHPIIDNLPLTPLLPLPWAADTVLDVLAEHLCGRAGVGGHDNRSGRADNHGD